LGYDQEKEKSHELKPDVTWEDSETNVRKGDENGNRD
jgi:hypothetical protein